LADRMKMSDLIDLRSSYQKDARKYAVAADKSEQGFHDLAAAADDALFAVDDIGGMTPEGAQFLRNTNAVYGASKGMFDHAFLKRAVAQLGPKGSPSRVVNEVFSDLDPDRLLNIYRTLTSPVPIRTGVGKVETSIAKQMRALKGELANVEGGDAIRALLYNNQAEGKALWKQLNARWFADQLIKAQDPKTGLFNIRQLNKTFRDIPDKSMKIMFPGARKKAVLDTIKLAGMITPGEKGFISVFGKGIELAGVRGMVGGGVGVLKGGGIALSPTAYAALATNPKATKLLTLGVKSNRGALKTAPFAARLLQLLMDDAKSDEKAMLLEHRRAMMKGRKHPPTGFGRKIR